MTGLRRAAGSLLARRRPRPSTDVDLRQLAVISTSHLPVELGPGGLDEAPGVIADGLPYGWLLWVPADVDSYVAEVRDDRAAGADGVPEPVVAIWRWARSLGCDWVMLDRDGPAVADLPTWRW